MSSDSCRVRLAADLAIDADALFKPAIEASPCGMVVVGPGAAMVLVNAEIERQFGYTREDLIGQPLALLLPAAVSSAEMLHGHQFPNQPQTRPIGTGRDVIARRKDGFGHPG